MPVKLKIMLISLTICILGADVFAEKTDSDKKSLSYKEFISHIDPQKNTSLHVEHFWTHNKGKRFTWKGKVVNVKGSRGKAEIHAAIEDAPLYKGLNVILVTHEKAAAAKLKIGQEFKFKGNVYNYRNHGGAFIVYMNNVQLISPEKE